MSTLEKLEHWLEPPVVEHTIYRCQDCETGFETRKTRCPACGGEITEHSEPIPYVWWDPYF